MVIVVVAGVTVWTDEPVVYPEELAVKVYCPLYPAGVQVVPAELYVKVLV